ncbi:MAG TPA: hypothetical protein VGR10_04260, partial [Thermoleophilaceae bacterium]|nr:hypothetical protein [Thermoleophilaceae bacterium]
MRLRRGTALLLCLPAIAAFGCGGDEEAPAEERDRQTEQPDRQRGDGAQDGGEAPAPEPPAEAVEPSPPPGEAPS